MNLPPITAEVVRRPVLLRSRSCSTQDCGRHDRGSQGALRSLEAEPQGRAREHFRELLVQDEFVDAPVIVWIAGNLAGVCARSGAAGHRQLLVRAGAAGYRLWIGGLGPGLAGSLIAGLLPGAARRLLGFDSYRQASLFAVAAGYGLQS